MVIIGKILGIQGRNQGNPINGSWQYAKTFYHSLCSDISIFNLALYGFIKVIFDKSIMMNSKLTNGNFPESSFIRANLYETNFEGGNFEKTNFTSANLTRANFKAASLIEANFNNANLFEADFTGANILNANFEGANLNNATWADGKKCGLNSIGQCNTK